MPHFLKRAFWQHAGSDIQARGAILVVANAGGRRYCLSTRDIHVGDFAANQDVDDANPMHFVGAILNDPVHTESVDVNGRSASVNSMSFEVMSEQFPIHEMRKTGMILQNIDVDVYWHVEGMGHTMDQALHLINGKLRSPYYDEESKTVSFGVEDRRLQGQKKFPPVVASQELIPAMADDHQGMVYPIVIGACKKVPCLNVNTATDLQFLVMGDPLAEFPAAPGGLVSEVYQDDTALGVNTDGYQTDTEGNRYYRVTTNAAATSRDVTADVTGHTPATVGETIRYLLTFFGDETSQFDMSSLTKLDSDLGGLTLAAVFNERVDRGALQAIQERLIGNLPIMMIQRGGKFEFKALKWDRDVKKHLSFSSGNLLRMAAGPTETDRSQVFNQFALLYGRSGLRGDALGVVTRDKDTDYGCLQSARRYDERAYPDIDGGDLADQESADLVINWHTETNSKMRVYASYECSLDTADVQLWDTVRVIDEFQDWDALFKVVGIRRGSEKYIVLDVVSMDDYVEVYKPRAPVVLGTEDVPEVPLWQNYWYFNGVDSYLEMPHNADFLVPSTTHYGNIMVGFRDVNKATSVSPFMLFDKGQASYNGATNGDMALLTYRLVAGDRYAQWHFRCGAGQNWKSTIPNDDYHDDADVCVVASRNCPDTNITAFLDDTDGADGANNAWTNTKLNYGGVSSLVIGAQRRQDGGTPAIRFYFKGRIYFFYWCLHPTNRLGDSVAELVLNHGYVPWEDSPTWDPDLYPSCLITFDQAVGATYAPEIQSGPNAPYVFTVNGTPIRNGP